MKAAIISIGDEVVSGQITNTNAAFLSSELENIGIEPHLHLSVRDNIEDIHYALKQAIKKCNIIITSGGLGPTPDDLTHKSIGSFFNLPLLLDNVTLRQIKKKLQPKYKKSIPKINYKQAYKPKSSHWITNLLGTANGIILKVRDKNQKQKVIITFPGVPKELRKMWETHGKKILKNYNSGKFIYSKVLKFTNIGESKLAEKIFPYLKLKNPRVATYVDTGEVKVRIVGNRKRLINNLAKNILNTTKEYYFGEDNQSLENNLVKKLMARKKTLAVAESCTGGLLSKRLTDISGSSKIFKLGTITYSNESKTNLLGIKNKVIKDYGSVSKKAALNMAKGVKSLANTDIGFSITGIAGPTGGTKSKPVGLVYFGLSTNRKTITKKVLFGNYRTRGEIRFLATQFALMWLFKHLT